MSIARSLSESSLLRDAAESGWPPTYKDPGWVQAGVAIVAFVVTVVALWAAFHQFRAARRELRDNQLKTGAHEPVQLAQDLSRLQVEVMRDWRTPRVPKEGVRSKIREMHFDLADVVSESRRSAGKVMDYAGWEAYFRDLLGEPGYPAALLKAEGWYTDHMFALFGRLYVRDQASLEVNHRIVVARRERDEPWPSSLGRWTFSCADASWVPSGLLADARLGLCEPECGEVRLDWHSPSEGPVRDEIRSWVAWHLVEGNVKVARWEEWGPGSTEPLISGLRRFRRSQRAWMDSGGATRFQVPKYRVVEFGLLRRLARRAARFPLFVGRQVAIAREYLW